MAFHFAGFAVFGDEFRELAEAAMLGVEAGEGGAVVFEVGDGEGDKRDCGDILDVEVDDADVFQFLHTLTALEMSIRNSLLMCLPKNIILFFVYLLTHLFSFQKYFHQ